MARGLAPHPLLQQVHRCPLSASTRGAPDAAGRCTPAGPVRHHVKGLEERSNRLAAGRVRLGSRAGLSRSRGGVRWSRSQGDNEKKDGGRSALCGIWPFPRRVSADQISHHWDARERFSPGVRKPFTIVAWCQSGFRAVPLVRGQKRWGAGHSGAAGQVGAQVPAPPATTGPYSIRQRLDDGKRLCLRGRGAVWRRRQPTFL